VSNHSPVPWTALPDSTVGDYVAIFDARGLPVGMVGYGSDPRLGEISREEMIANGRLVLSAADLLNALTAPLWLVWSNEHAAWWGPNNRGYYLDIGSAGRYSLQDALACCRARSPAEAGKNTPELIQPSPELMRLWAEAAAKAKGV
jgi:hypothetical protein